MPIYEPVLILKPEAVTIADTARIDSFVKIEGGQGVAIGEYVHISSFCHINVGGGAVTIGDHVGVASGAKILGGSNKPAGKSMSAASPAEMQVIERSATYISDYAFVGANATVMPGVYVGPWAVVGAGAVVTKDVDAFVIVAGVPARPIGRRVCE
jgi:acetyltransferase-like isoleucine patch superfamily enzyme